MYSSRLLVMLRTIAPIYRTFSIDRMCTTFHLSQYQSDLPAPRVVIWLQRSVASAFAIIRPGEGSCVFLLQVRQGLSDRESFRN